MKGIILAGGSGTRLYPLTSAVSKQLLPVYNKPTIYYPLSLLMLAGIKDILIISTPRDLPRIEELLGSGDNFGIKLSYKVQPKPEGIAQAFILGQEFINKSPVSLVLGDNLFFGQEMQNLLEKAAKIKDGACVFGYQVQDPERYGVVEFDTNKKAISIEEKPQKPKSKWAVTGLYFYDSNVCEMAKKLKPSKRGELEITDLNLEYLKAGKLKVELLGRGVAWLDTGSAESLLSASQFVQTLEKRQGLQIACLEEIALSKGFLTPQQLTKIAEKYPSSEYGLYVRNLVHE
ncbi:MAG: glucose-1-phosphate thymidylyltransferase RfbA [Oligoflexia bacterium]|nr:glucose-1-phosphate thymidylyltransferase RfbA [Oligoflexia bacterium]